MTRDDLLNPRLLPKPYSPAVVYTTDNERTFVADVNLLENGWASLKRWDRSRVKVPAHRIEQIEMAPTETTRQEDMVGVQIVDDDALEEARRLAQPTVEADTDQVGEVADD
ncbi:hypothetical protein [Halorhabdus amylolytica]|uniref:hypothetical protein n=1 Tax=Halorhabdus amylolytica TaxID=2559573 RepID=UPI0010AA2949|nr:hypothetical protein [Halorhabdus amylolytica]